MRRWLEIGKRVGLLELVMVCAWFLGQRFLPLRETFLGKTLGEYANQPLVWSRANFDGVHYVSIARSGYGYMQQAFFPFYPKLIKWLQPLCSSFLVSALIISNLSFFFALAILQKLLEEEGVSKKTIRRTLWWLVLFPTSFYFISAYSESLFLLLVVLSFWLAHKRRWLLAGLVAGLASYTRLVGIFLYPALLAEYYQQQSRRTMRQRAAALVGEIKAKNWQNWLPAIRRRLGHFKNLAFLTTGCWGLIAYMHYLKKTTGDWLYFVKAQPHFGAGRQINKIVMLYQVFWRYLKMIFTVSPTASIYPILWLEFLVALLFLFLLAWGWYKGWARNSWLIFAGLAYLLPTLTGTFSSLPRYVLVCFPAFLVLAKLKLPRFVFWLSGVLLLIFASLFVRGWWVA